MIEGTTSEGGSQDNLVRRGLALVASLLVVLWTVWLTIAAPADARPSAGDAAAQPVTTTTSEDPTTTAPPTTPTTRPPTTTRPTTTAPPQTTESTSPPTSDDPPVTEDTEPDPDEEPEEQPDDTGTTRDADLLGRSPISTSMNLLVGGNGTPGSESAQAPADEPTKDGGSSDEDRVIWMIIAGLGAVALLVALLTWRYWLLTRPGIDLSDDDPDGGLDGGGYYGGEPPAPPSDPYGAPAPRMADVNPMTTGLPPAPAATGWPDPAAPPRPPQRRGPAPGPVPEPSRRTRQPRRAEADPFPSQPAQPPAAPPQRGRGRGRRGGDPFWDDVGDQPPRRQPPDQGRRRPDPGGLGERDPWGRGR